MKQRSNLFSIRSLAFAAFAFLILGAISCTPGTGSRGWAAPLKSGEDTLLLATGRGRLDAIRIGTGDPLWRFPRDWHLPDSRARSFKGFYAAPVLSSDGRTVFVGDYNGYIYAFRPAERITGNEKPIAASLKLNGPVVGGLVLEPATGQLLVTSGERVFAVSTADLERRIENRDANVAVREVFKTDGEIWSAPLVQGGRVFFASHDGNLYAIEQSTGNEVWRFEGTRALVTSPAVAGGTILVGGFDDRLHALDMSTGNQRWEFKAGNWIWSRPLVDGDRVYIGDFDGSMHALRASDGSVIWTQHLADGPIVGSPALADGVLVVAAQNGELFGLDPAGSARRWGPTDLRTSVNSNLVADGNRVLVAPNGCVTPLGEKERVYYVSIDARTGAPTRTSGVC